MKRLPVGFLAAVLLGGCGDYDYREGVFRCSPIQGGDCPQGMICAWSPQDSQYRCFRNPPDIDGGPGCGNGIREGVEECDGEDLAGETCESQGQPSGLLGCTNQCTFDFAECGTEFECGDGQDNDEDGRTDCGDEDCEGDACDSAGRVCAAGNCLCPGGTVETECDDTQDNDCDGSTDCADSDCEMEPVCLADVCQAADAIVCGPAHTSDTTGQPANMDDYSCTTINESGPEFVYSFLATTDATVTATLTDFDGDLNLYILDGSSGVCHPAYCSKFSARTAADFETVSFYGVAGTTYYVVVDSGSANAGSYSISLTCGVCGNGTVEPGEDCDDAGESANCDSDCSPVECGDGLLNVTAGEECDDGDTVPGDGCSANCALECVPTNLAQRPGVVASSSGGGNPPDYGPEKMIDGYGEPDCVVHRFHWVSADNFPAAQWVQLEWPNPVTVSSLAIDTTRALDTPCNLISTGRTLAGGTIQWWDGLFWVTDGSVTGRTNDWTYTFTVPVETTKIRIYDLYATNVGGQQINPIIIEWEVYECN